MNLFISLSPRSDMVRATPRHRRPKWGHDLFENEFKFVCLFNFTWFLWLAGIDTYTYRKVASSNASCTLFFQSRKPTYVFKSWIVGADWLGNCVSLSNLISKKLFGPNVSGISALSPGLHANRCVFHRTGLKWPLLVSLIDLHDRFYV